MAFDNLLLERDGAVAIVTINRPKVLNALNAQTIDDLRRAFLDLQRDPDIRAIVLTGSSDRAFAAGADIKEMAGAGAIEMYGRMRFGQWERIRKLRKPLIAAVSGFCLGGGNELAMACDLIVAGAGARIGDAHANFGVFPGAGGAAVLPRRIGPTAAKYLLFSGDTMPAADLVPLGLVNRVVPDDQLLAEVDKLAAQIASKSPLVLRRMKQAVADALEQPQSTALRMERLVLEAHRHSHDIREGLAAFVGKRKPEFKGY